MENEETEEAIPIRCPRCGEIFEVGISFEDRKTEGDCPSCGRELLFVVVRDEWGDAELRAEPRS